MQKKFYQKELLIKATQQRKGVNNNKKDVEKIQSWLNLFAMQNPGTGTATGIDGDFGPATEKAVVNFQKFNSLIQTGVVDQNLFDKLASPLKKAFEIFYFLKFNILRMIWNYNNKWAVKN